MNWQDIKVSPDQTHFLYEGNNIFKKQFHKVMKFHSPGLAPVADITGAYHINTSGEQLYPERFTSTFGFYCNRASVALGDKWFHLTNIGERAYLNEYAWTGNFQEDLCPVRDGRNHYFHINKSGLRIYKEDYLYCGDFKDGYACVRQTNQLCRHINLGGQFINDCEFIDLGVFHKGYATARDTKGWHHIDLDGNEIYKQRFQGIEPFYNGFALVTQFDNNKIIIDERGTTVLAL